MAALRGGTAERRLCSCQHVPDPAGGLIAVDGMARVITGARRHNRHHIRVMQATKPEIGDREHILLLKTLVGALRADIVHPAAAPCRMGGQGSVRVFGDKFRIP